ncbi:MAG: ATP-binding cassette domain-containing protein [Lachnospiraceae bacterium]|nr:ATP-binding cassette domain-containing protein [Lachnospiraceae bacterium]
MENKKVILSIKDLYVKFRVRGRILTAIRGISLDIYDNETIAIVGESGSGKSVFTKTFAGMLDSNGFIDQGSIVFNDPELSDTVVKYDASAKNRVAELKAKLDEYSHFEFGSDIHKEILALEAEKRAKNGLSDEEEAAYKKELKAKKDARVELFNLKQTYDPSLEKDKIKEAAAELKKMEADIKAFEKANEDLKKQRRNAAEQDPEFMKNYHEKMHDLKTRYAEAIKAQISEETKERNDILAKEIYLSCGRFKLRKRRKTVKALLEAMKQAMIMGVDLNNMEERNKVFDPVTFRVKFENIISMAEHIKMLNPEQEISADDSRNNIEMLHGECVLNLASFKDATDWMQVRGAKIATVFQDPMTSLNPILTIGKQISSIIMKHQGCSEADARLRAIEIMGKVGIPNPELRFDDYPFQYSGGMRQRIVIAIALSCQPKILICDEPTTALDVTIQAQILQLIKDLQKEFNFTTVFITHDLGVVANVADRVAVLYAGQVIEVGNVEEVFYNPQHPYTWALLSSLPQLATKDTKLYSITGTPPSLYNAIKGDAFAPRNPYCMKIDTLAEPPMFKVSDTHYAKTWLLHPDAPKVEKPEIIQDIHEKLLKTYNLQ